MKTFCKFLLLVALTILIGGCKSQQTLQPQSQSTDMSFTEQNSYPVPNAILDSNQYPIQSAQETPVPDYLIPGFITMTPDASLTSIIVSEVCHEDDVESIYIKNISSTTQEISNYMIYSPKLDVRKIFPSNLVLEPGESFVLYNGANLEKYPEAQRWLDAPVLTDTLDEVWLTNSAARILYYFIYYPSITP